MVTLTFAGFDGKLVALIAGGGEKHRIGRVPASFSDGLFKSSVAPVPKQCQPGLD
jgi:hypothetical protein